MSCDCRRVFFQVIGRTDPNRVLASINYGWEKESFYRKRMPWDPEASRMIVRGDLDPLYEQAEFAGELLEIFRNIVADVPYRMRLIRHHKMFREELARRAAKK